MNLAKGKELKHLGIFCHKVFIEYNEGVTWLPSVWLWGVGGGVGLVSSNGTIYGVIIDTMYLCEPLYVHDCDVVWVEVLMYIWSVRNGKCASVCFNCLYVCERQCAYIYTCSYVYR